MSFAKSLAHSQIANGRTVAMNKKKIEPSDPTSLPKFPATTTMPHLVEGTVDLPCEFVHVKEKKDQIKVRQGALASMAPDGVTVTYRHGRWGQRKTAAFFEWDSSMRLRYSKSEVVLSLGGGSRASVRVAERGGAVLDSFRERLAHRHASVVDAQLVESLRGRVDALLDRAGAELLAREVRELVQYAEAPATGEPSESLEDAASALAADAADCVRHFRAAAARPGEPADERERKACLALLHEAERLAGRVTWVAERAAAEVAGDTFLSPDEEWW